MTAGLAERVLVAPSHINQPAAHHSLLPLVEQVCKELLSEELEPEQRLAIEVLTGQNADGTPVSLAACVICARQNLKTFILERIILTLLLQPRNGVRVIVWTSQRLVTCDLTFERFVNWFEGVDPDGDLLYPELAVRLVGINRGKGTKSITVRTSNGEVRSINFLARSPKSGQGITGDVIVFDEGFAVEAEHSAALIPTLTQRRRAMVFWGSSACHADSEQLRKVVLRGRKGGRNAPAFIEWSSPGSLKKPGCRAAGCRHEPADDDVDPEDRFEVTGCSLDNFELIKMANPLAGRIRADGEGITWKFLAAERYEYGPAQYARERLGWHEDPVAAVEAPITVEMWKSRDDDKSALPEGARVVFSPEIALDRKSACIAVAGFREDGRTHTGLIAADAGTSWLLPRLRALALKHEMHEIERGPVDGKKKRCVGIVIDPSSPTGGLIDDLRRRWVDDDGKEHPGFEPVIMSSQEVGAAAGDMFDALRDDTTRHCKTRAVETAIKGAVKRELGDGGWTYGRSRSAREAIDITPAVACTNARWALSIVRKAYDIMGSLW